MTDRFICGEQLPRAAVALGSWRTPRTRRRPMKVLIVIASVALSSFALAAHAQGRSASDADTQRAEVALSNETLQLRYIGREGQVGEGGRVSGEFFLSEERDIVLSVGVLFPAGLPDNLS